MSCPYSKNPLVHNAPSPTCTHTIWFKSCTDLFATHAVPLKKKPGRRERRRRRRRKERDNRRKDEDAACIAISVQGGGDGGKASKVFRACNLEIFCLCNQPAGPGGRRNKQGFQPLAKHFYLRNQPAGTQREAKEARLSMQP